MEEKHQKIIKGINEEAWEKYGKLMYLHEDSVFKKMYDGIKAGKHDDDAPEEDLNEFMTAYEAGLMPAKEKEVNPKTMKLFDNYVQRRLVEEIKAGRLPNPKDTEVYKKFKEIQNNDTNTPKKTD